MTSCYLNGEYIDQQSASISVRDRGFRFGDGLFETIWLENGVPYAWEAHMQRLGRGLSALMIDYDTAELQALCHQLLLLNAADEPTVLRIAVTRGAGGVGFMPVDGSPTVLIETMRRKPLNEGPVSLYRTDIRKPAPSSLELAGAKTASALHYVLARVEAKRAGCHEGLMLSPEDNVVECDSSNIFWVRGEVIYTPALSLGLMPGTTREAILRLSPFQVIEGIYPIEHMLAAEEVFVTNVVRGVMSVGSIQPMRKYYEATEKAVQLAGLLMQDRADYTAANAYKWRRPIPVNVENL